jgi:hypothetical protein
MSKHANKPGALHSPKGSILTQESASSASSQFSGGEETESAFQASYAKFKSEHGQQDAEINELAKAGTRRYANGAQYSGDFDADGLKTGYGKMLYMNETSYTGEFQGGLRSGFGMQVYSGQSRAHVDAMVEMGPEYLALLQTDKAPRRIVTPDAKAQRTEAFYTYIGQFKNDMRHGHGELKWVDGARFIG